MQLFMIYVWMYLELEQRYEGAILLALAQQLTAQQHQMQRETDNHRASSPYGATASYGWRGGFTGAAGRLSLIETFDTPSVKAASTFSCTRLP